MVLIQYCTEVCPCFYFLQKIRNTFLYRTRAGIGTVPQEKKLKTIQGMVLIQYCTVRNYVHVFIFFKKLGIPFCTAPVPVCQFICPVNTIMKSFEIYLTKNLHLYKCTYVLHSLRMLFSFFLFLKFQLPYRNQFLMCVRMYVCMIRMYINVFIAKIQKQEKKLKKG